LLTEREDHRAIGGVAKEELLTEREEHRAIDKIGTIAYLQCFDTIHGDNGAQTVRDKNSREGCCRLHAWQRFKPMTGATHPNTTPQKCQILLENAAPHRNDRNVNDNTRMAEGMDIASPRIRSCSNPSSMFSVTNQLPETLA
jgi:hypothetical protein